MARTPAPHATFRDEPSIIVDPSLYLPERRCFLQVVCDAFLDITRAVLVIALAGVTVFSVVHVIRRRSLTRVPAAPYVIQVADRSQADMQLASAGMIGLGRLEQEIPADRVGGAFGDALNRMRAPSLVEARAGARERSDVEARAGVRERNDVEVRSDEDDVLRPGPARVRIASLPSAIPTPRRALDVVIDIRTGQRMLAQRRFDEAERAFLDALALRTGQPAALSGLARVNLARGELDKAFSLAQRAVTAAPNQASYHLTLGDVLRVSGDASAADAQYELASRLNPRPAIAARGALPPNPF